MAATRQTDDRKTEPRRASVLVRRADGRVLVREDVHRAAIATAKDVLRKYLAERRRII